jgi:feruloyl-CoA synthase
MRAAILAATRGVLLDIVIAGENCESCALLCWLNPTEAARISKTSASDLTCDPLVVQFLKDRFKEYNETVGSSERIYSFSLLKDPPSLAAGEITDKAYVNQRAVLKNRSAVAQTGTVSSVDEEKPIANQAHALSAVPNWAIA